MDGDAIRRGIFNPSLIPKYCQVETDSKSIFNLNTDFTPVQPHMSDLQKVTEHSLLLLCYETFTKMQIVLIRLIANKRI